MGESKKNLVKSIIVIVVIFIVLYAVFKSDNKSMMNSDSAKKFLEEKYNERFTFRDVIDSSNAGELAYGANVWEKYAFFSELGNVTKVSCNKDRCADDYYIILKKQDIIKYIKKSIDETNAFPSDYKFYYINHNVCDSELKYDTVVDEAFKLDPSCFSRPINVFIREGDYFNKDDSSFEKVFEKYNIYSTIYVYTFSDSDYEIFNKDENNYIYDFIESDRISVGINNRYLKIDYRRNQIYEFKLKKNT